MPVQISKVLGSGAPRKGTAVVAGSACRDLVPPASLAQPGTLSRAQMRLCLQRQAEFQRAAFPLFRASNLILAGTGRSVCPHGWLQQDVSGLAALLQPPTCTLPGSDTGLGMSPEGPRSPHRQWVVLVASSPGSLSCDPVAVLAPCPPPPSLTAELIRLIIKVNDDGRVGVHFKSECVFM